MGARVRLKDGVDETTLTPELMAKALVHMWLKDSRQTHQLEEAIASMIRWERDRCARVAKAVGADQIERLIRNLPGGEEGRPASSIILPPGFASTAKN